MEQENPKDEGRNETEGSQNGTAEGQKHGIHYPDFVSRFGVWPINIGLFFFYNNLVSIVVMIVGLMIMSSTGIADQKIISEKLGGLSVISTLITLGLTLIYSRRFYFSRD